MIQIEIDWSDYTDYKVAEYKHRCLRRGYSPTEKMIEDTRKTNQPPTSSVCYGINPNNVESYCVCKGTERYYWVDAKYDKGVASGSCIITITFTNGRVMKLYCDNDAADKIVTMLQGEKSDNTVKINGVKEYEIYTETHEVSISKTNR